MAQNKGIEYIVIDSIAASGAEVVLDAGTLTVGNSTVGTVAVPYKRISYWKKRVKVAETAQVSTGTPTAANSTVYWVTIQQKVGSDIITRKFSVTSAAAATETTIVTQLKAAINADASLRVAATGTTTLIITADAGYPRFVVSASSNISFAATTPAVDAVNTGALLYAAGYTNVTSTNNYTSYYIEYVKPQAGADSTTTTPVTKRVMILANEADTDITAFRTAMDNAGTADDGAGVTDADAIAVV